MLSLLEAPHGSQIVTQVTSSDPRLHFHIFHLHSQAQVPIYIVAFSHLFSTLTCLDTDSGDPTVHELSPHLNRAVLCFFAPAKSPPFQTANLRRPPSYATRPDRAKTRNQKCHQSLKRLRL